VHPAKGYFAHAWPLAFAHRGGAGEGPENCWEAFERAVGLGYSYMETDVRTSADGVAVASHDADIQRATGRPDLVAELSWEELRRVPTADGRGVPRLDDLLGTWPHLRWNIDVKCRSAVAPVAAAIRRTGAADRALVTSFSYRRTAAVRRSLGTPVATGASPAQVGLLSGAKLLSFLPRRAGERAPRQLAAQVPPLSGRLKVVDERFVRTCHRYGVAVHVWTIDDPVQMEHLLDLGVDGIMTDLPSVLKEVLVRRKQWS